MKIGALAAQTGVSTDTLRFYEKRGLIRSERRDNGYRDFDDAFVRIVGLIRLGQKLGFSLSEMRELVDAVSQSTVSADDTREMLQQKLTDVDARLAELTQMRQLLTDTIARVCPLST